MEEFKYSGTALTNEILFRKKLRADINQRIVSIVRCKFFVFQFSIQKFKDEDIQNYNFEFLYQCEIWSLRLRVERRLRVFENSVLRRIFGPKRDEVTAE